MTVAIIIGSAFLLAGFVGMYLAVDQGCRERKRRMAGDMAQITDENDAAVGR
jgi:hypothetical protein